ncbi:MAG: tripartite tricarboxylate transporter substrate-binding protein, partial [Methylibium sp.]
DVPTFRESGLPGFTFESWYGVWAPKDTPPERIAALNAAINAATAELARSGQLANLGFEPVTETPSKFRSHIAAEVAEGSELLRSAGFRPE